MVEIRSLSAIQPDRCTLRESGTASINAKPFSVPRGDALKLSEYERPKLRESENSCKPCGYYNIY